MISNPVLDCIRSRRSTRSFEDRQIQPEHLDALLEAAAWAPSGSNGQSWLFTAVQNQELLSQLNALVREAFQHWVPDEDYPAKLVIKTRAQSDSFSFCHQAPALIIASNRPGYENAMADCALALENVFLAAESLGLGSCYINHLHWLREDSSVRAFLYELGIPRNHTICNSAAIGYIKKPSPVPARKEGVCKIIR